MEKLPKPQLDAKSAASYNVSSFSSKGKSAEVTKKEAALEARLTAKMQEQIREREAKENVRYVVAIGYVDDVDPETGEKTTYKVKLGVAENKIRQVIKERRREENISGRQWKKLRKKINRRRKATDRAEKTGKPTS